MPQQALVSCAVKIAEQYKGADATEWMRAAQTLRSPYWDWAINTLPPPEVIERAKVKIIKATGETEVNNPLLSYRFKSGEPKVGNRPFTVRCPTPMRPNETNLTDLKRCVTSKVLRTVRFSL